MDAGSDSNTCTISDSDSDADTGAGSSPGIPAADTGAAGPPRWQPMDPDTDSDTDFHSDSESDSDSDSSAGTGPHGYRWPAARASAAHLRPRRPAARVSALGAGPPATAAAAASSPARHSLRLSAPALRPPGRLRRPRPCQCLAGGPRSRPRLGPRTLMVNVPGFKLPAAHSVPRQCTASGPGQGPGWPDATERGRPRSRGGPT